MTSFGGTSEIDKCMQNVTYNNLNADQLYHQNGGNITHITNSTIGYLNGTPRRMLYRQLYYQPSNQRSPT
jgi:hypothetical protein